MQTDRSPRVSIISPVYNAQPFIRRCIDSVLTQSFGDWEQIIVDDGSSDETGAIVNSYGDPRIQYIALPHRGLTALADTYNTGLLRARGDLIAILEGDDCYPSDKLERQVPAFDDDDVTLSWGRALVVDGADRVVRRWPSPRISRRDMPNSEMFRLLARWNVLPALTVMLRRRALQQIGGFRQLGSPFLVDLPTWLMVSGLVPGRARFIDHNLGLYRQHGTNTGLLYNAELRLEHERIVAAAVTEIGTDRLRQLGWGPRDEQVARASARLTQGIAHLQQGERTRARAAFADALSETRSMGEYLTALAGYSSAVLNINVIARAQKLRYSAALLSMRIKERALSR